MKLPNIYPLLIGVFAFMLLVSCGRNNTLKGIFQKSTAYENYSKALKEAELDKTALGREWIKAGQAVFKDSIYINLPYSESAYFAANEATANGYRFIAERGQKVVVKIEVLSMENATIFLDMFSIGEEPEHLATADTTELNLEHEIEEDGEYLLRLQPELLRGGRYVLSITSAPVLAFPVWGKNSTSIASFYGAARDAGRRQHEGVDIFAPRGTPVLATTEGTIGRVNTNRLGGKVVWLRDGERNLNYYYAHLDSQLVEAGQKVMIGDTLGLVGNTGNAITTPPHLHFGIYSFGRGAIDPYSFLHEKNREVEASAFNRDLLGQKMRISAPTVNFRLSADLDAAVIAKLPEHTLLKVVGTTEEWLRVATPTNVLGFIHASLVEPIERPLSNMTIDSTQNLYDYPTEAGIAMVNLSPGASINVLAAFRDYYYVRTIGETEGWIQR